MIKIEFEEPNTDEWIGWCEECAREGENLVKLFLSQQPIEFTQSLYKRFKSLYIDPEGPFHGKCAYCEESIYENQHGDVEHFRPKARVTDEDNKPVRISVDGEEMDHPGYYWLAYDWKNLLISCSLCNQQPSFGRSESDKIGKGNRFPVLGFRASKPDEENDEQAILINPVLEDPDEYLEVDTSGVLFAKNNNQRGISTINILGLNERRLPLARKKVYDDTRNKLGILSTILSSGVGKEEALKMLNELLNNKKGKGEFSIAVRKALRDCASDFSPIIELFDN